MIPTRERVRRAVELLGGPYAVPSIVAGAVVFALLSSCSQASAQGTTYKDAPGELLDFVLTEQGWSDNERGRVKSALAVRANAGAVGAGASWLGAASKAARLAGYAGVALTAYEAYDMMFGSDPETAMPEPQDFDVPVNFPVDNSWSSLEASGITMSVDGWLNDFLHCPGFGSLTACVQDAVYKDIHVQMQRGTDILRGNEFSDNWEADPGSMRIISVEITAQSPDYSGTARPNQMAGPHQYDYTAIVEVDFYNRMTNEKMGTSRVTYTGRVRIGTVTVNSSGEQSNSDPICVRFPNQFPVNGQIHLCGIGPLNSPASNVPVRLDEVNEGNLVPQWMRYQDPNPALLAELFNSWGRDLHTLPGYDDLRWREISPEDLRHAWPMPNVQDLNSPIRNPSTGTYPWAPTQPSTPPGTGPGPVTPPNPNPDPDPTPEPNPNPGGPGEPSEPDLDWSHPDVPDPELTHPTIADIIDPILGVFPGLQQLQVDGPPGICPTASFEVFDTYQTIDSHCEILEENRRTLSIISVLVWSILAMFVVLSA